MSNTLSRILQTVDDVTFQVVDVKKKHKKRRKKVKNENDTDKRGDSIHYFLHTNKNQLFNLSTTIDSPY